MHSGVKFEGVQKMLWNRSIEYAKERNWWDWTSTERSKLTEESGSVVWDKQIKNAFELVFKILSYIFLPFWNVDILSISTGK